MEYNLKLRELRERKRLSQRDVAAKVNVTPGAVAKWELGYTMPTLENLMALVNLLECTTDQLLGLDEDGQTSA